MSPTLSACALPAHQGPGDSLAAPAVAGQGVCTSRNAHQWRQIAFFLAGFEVLAAQRPALIECADDRARKRSAGAVAALSRSIPDGNHGDNLGSIK